MKHGGICYGVQGANFATCFGIIQLKIQICVLHRVLQICVNLKFFPPTQELRDVQKYSKECVVRIFLPFDVPMNKPRAKRVGWDTCVLSLKSPLNSTVSLHCTLSFPRKMVQSVKTMLQEKRSPLTSDSQMKTKAKLPVAVCEKYL